jgi:peptide/nickel transport system permease protein
MNATLSWMGQNRLLAAGLFIIVVLLLISLIGPYLIDEQGTKIGYALPDQSPNREFLLGTDTVGRQMLPTIIVGMPLTLRVGIIAGALGLAIGVVLGFVSGFYGGVADAIIRGSADTLLTVPVLLLLVVVASTLTSALTVNMEALMLAGLTWMGPTRIIRSQVLSMRERAYVDVARASGANGFQIIFLELMPNLLPYIAVSFVGAVAQAILGSIGIEALGLGPQNENTLGMTIYWSLYHSSVVRGLWWWFAPPIIVIVVLFIGLFLMSAGLDRIANPRLRRSG